MKNTTQIMRRCHALALAGLIGAGTIVPAGTSLAVGPGETQSATVISPVGPGQSSAGSTGTASGTGSTSGQSASTANPNAWKKVNGVYQMPDGSAINNVLFRGIDVSRWQGDINWSQVAADDVSFVMLGTRSKGAVDPYFHRNIQQASAAGVKVGVYIYSLAMTPEMAVEEANFVLNLIHDYPVSYPVAFDMEDSTQGTLSKDELAAIANAFCGRISEAGYYPVIYANDNWLANKLDMSKMNYPVWVARYSAKPAYQNPVMWQATSTGAVNGISGNVDIDFQFKDFTSVIPANTWRTINGQTYYYQNYAKQKNNWIQDDGTWYYMNGDGLVSKGWLNQSGKSYYLDDTTGKMITGWKSDSGKWYYFGSSGALSKGWINDNGTWYYSSQDGVMQTGWLDDGGERYYLKGSGAMATGWREMDGAWYYFEGSGRMAKGVIDVGGLHYYMDPSTGRMAAGTTVDIGGVAYTADGSGVLSQVVQEAGNETGDSQTGNVQTQAPDGSQGGQAPQPSQNGGVGPGCHRFIRRTGCGGHAIRAVTAAAGFNVMDNKLNHGIIFIRI